MRTSSLGLHIDRVCIADVHADGSMGDLRDGLLLLLSRATLLQRALSWSWLIILRSLSSSRVLHTRSSGGGGVCFVQVRLSHDIVAHFQQSAEQLHHSSVSAAHRAGPAEHRPSGARQALDARQEHVVAGGEGEGERWTRGGGGGGGRLLKLQPHDGGGSHEVVRCAAMTQPAIWATRTLRTRVTR